MRVKVMPAADDACGYYRLAGPGAHLTKTGEDVEVQFDRPDAAKRLHVHLRDGSPVSACDPECDVIVLQRVTSRVMAQAIPIYQQMGVRIVVDIDDDYHSLPPTNPCHQQVDPLRDADNNKNWLMEACRLADAVTCTTPALLQRYGFGHGSVVPNYVPESFLDKEKASANAAPVVGWAGNMDVHWHDLAAANGGVAVGMQGTDAVFRLVGTPEHLDAVRGELRYTGAIEATGWQEFDSYPSAIAGLDVGVVPLARGPFNEAKSWLKGLEYAAVGVPFVATATSPYRDLASRGVGEVVRRPDQWAREVRRLVVDPSYRSDVGTAGRDAAKALTIEANAWRFLEAWSGK